MLLILPGTEERYDGYLLPAHAMPPLLVQEAQRPNLDGLYTNYRIKSNTPLGWLKKIS